MSVFEDLKMQYKIGGISNKLIYWNILLFVIPYVTVAIFAMFGIKLSFLQYVSLSSVAKDLLYAPWSILTYIFFHASIFHIFFNLVVLNFSAKLFEIYFNQKQLLGVYLLGGIFSGIFYLLGYEFLPYLNGIYSTLIGASGAVMSLLFAAVSYNPMMQVRLFLLGNVKLWQIAIVLICIDLIQLTASNTGGHLAHLGGALFGYIFIFFLKRGFDLSVIVTKIINGLVNFFGSKRSKTPFKKIHKNYHNPVNKSASVAQPKVKIKDKNQQQIDDILDKIGKSGYDSLTQAEKDFLFKASK